MAEQEKIMSDSEVRAYAQARMIEDLTSATPEHVAEVVEALVTFMPLDYARAIGMAYMFDDTITQIDKEEQEKDTHRQQEEGTRNE